MGWRSIVISRPAKLTLNNNALLIQQDGNQVRIPIEDISTLVIDNVQVSLTAQLLSAFAEAQIAVITVSDNHHPNGVLLSFHPHTRALKVMRAQLALTQPTQKRLWQKIIQMKISNQAQVLVYTKNDCAAKDLFQMAENVRSGDKGNLEGKAAQRYFRALFGNQFTRQKDDFQNITLNYGYAVIRAAIARSLVSYGFLPAFGIFHRSEQNSFNLADDLIEAYRPFVDLLIVNNFYERLDNQIFPEDKKKIVSVLHQDVHLNTHATNSKCTLLVAIDTTVQSLSRIILQKLSVDSLALPVLIASSKK